MMDVGFCLPNANATGRTCAVASPKLESVHLARPKLWRCVGIEAPSCSDNSLDVRSCFSQRLPYREG